MEIVMQESVKIPNSVVVSGLSAATGDEEVSISLQKYGSINRCLRIDDPKSDFYKHMIVEFTYGTAMQILEPILPLKLCSSTQVGIMYEIESLASVYTLATRSKVTKTYVEQLCETDKLGGNSLNQ